MTFFVAIKFSATSGIQVHEFQSRQAMLQFVTAMDLLKMVIVCVWTEGN